jgi:hypothetical protein
MWSDHFTQSGGFCRLSNEEVRPSGPESFQFIKSPGAFRHKMNNYVPHVYEIPLVIRLDLALPAASPAEDIYILFPCKFLNMPQQPLYMGIAGNCANDEKIGPAVQFPKIHDHHILPVVIPKQFTQFLGCFIRLKRIVH